MAQYRKKPVVIEAHRYPGHKVDGVNEIMAFEEWLQPFAKKAMVAPMRYVGQSLVIPTLEGNMAASPGDWIICGTKGELYPCKPDIFEATYEPATPDSIGGK